MNLPTTTFAPGVRLAEARIRFQSNVIRTDTCWYWIGHTDSRGYGKMNSTAVGVQIIAHRLAWELHVGPIPDGLQIDHLCRVKSCVNPDHLEPVTAAENMRRMSLAQTSCKRAGHDWAIPRNVYARPNGHRLCKECARINDRKRRAA